jgi:hypothetical protein
MTEKLSNRRRARRGPVKTVARIECRKGTTGLGHNLAVAALDLSENGVRLVIREPLPPGQQVEILLSGPDLAKPIRRLGQVVWSAALAVANHGAGVAFDKSLPYAELQRLLRPQ